MADWHAWLHMLVGLVVIVHPLPAVSTFQRWRAVRAFRNGAPLRTERRSQWPWR